MPRIEFKAPDYTENGQFVISDYIFEGDEKSGWIIYRNGDKHLELPSGYRAVKTVYCGVCSTDLARAFLPYPLPQIIGHEVVVQTEKGLAVVEINASHDALGHDTGSCPFCSAGLPTQCPDRITMGIDRLPGGFAPWLLAPVNAIIDIPDDFTPEVASLMEPFAAALHAVESFSPQNGQRIAVIGPRRLGALIIAALDGHRKEKGLTYTISAIVRNEKPGKLAENLGADEIIDTVRSDISKHFRSFDIVYDTTGNPEGFEQALALSRNIVHLKSTTGQITAGMHGLTDLVVDEHSILPYSRENMNFTWEGETAARSNRSVYVSPEFPEKILQKIRDENPDRVFHRMHPIDAVETIRNHRGFPSEGLLPRFDLALVATLEEADRVIRPQPGVEFSILRPRGVILLHKDIDWKENSPLVEAIIKRDIHLISSRCGDFRRAVALLTKEPATRDRMEKFMITHNLPLSEIESAFELAKDSKASIKVIVRGQD